MRNVLTETMTLVVRGSRVSSEPNSPTSGGSTTVTSSADTPMASSTTTAGYITARRILFFIVSCFSRYSAM